jgi:hypothetical protein
VFYLELRNDFLCLVSERIEERVEKERNTLGENRLRGNQRFECYRGTAGYQQWSITGSITWLKTNINS